MSFWKEVAIASSGFLFTLEISRATIMFFFFLIGAGRVKYYEVTNEKFGAPMVDSSLMPVSICPESDITDSA